MKRKTIFIVICLILIVILAKFYSELELSKEFVTVEKGDSELKMISKMNGQGFRDITAETQYSFYHALSCEQKYYWWQFPDKTTVAILLTGQTKDDLTVSVIEIGERGKGIENWREQKLIIKCKIERRSFWQSIFDR